MNFQNRTKGWRGQKCLYSSVCWSCGYTYFNPTGIKKVKIQLWNCRSKCSLTNHFCKHVMRSRCSGSTVRCWHKILRVDDKTTRMSMALLYPLTWLYNNVFWFWEITWSVMKSSSTIKESIPFFNLTVRRLAQVGLIIKRFCKICCIGKKSKLNIKWQNKLVVHASRMTPRQFNIRHLPLFLWCDIKLAIPLTSGELHHRDYNNKLVDKVKERSSSKQLNCQLVIGNEQWSHVYIHYFTSAKMNVHYMALPLVFYWGAGMTTMMLFSSWQDSLTLVSPHGLSETFLIILYLHASYSYSAVVC